MNQLRIRQAISALSDQYELATRSDGEAVASEGDALECGLEILTPDELRRRLQSHLAREQNIAGHVGQLYRNARQARAEGVDLDKLAEES